VVTKKSKVCLKLSVLSQLFHGTCWFFEASEIPTTGRSLNLSFFQIPRPAGFFHLKIFKYPEPAVLWFSMFSHTQTCWV
jgi:hypothetical protein